MDFYDVLDRVVDLLRSRGRVSYHALKRQFGLDDAYLEDLKVELIKSQRLAVAYPALVQGLVMVGMPLAQQGRRPIDRAQEFLRKTTWRVRYGSGVPLSSQNPGSSPW